MQHLQHQVQFLQVLQFHFSWRINNFICNSINKLNSSLQQHILRIDPISLYPIPQISQSSLQLNQTFTINHLQSSGLQNDCGSISLILCLNRVSFRLHLLDPNFCVTAQGSVDFAILVLIEVSEALPCQNAFSLQVFTGTLLEERLILHLIFLMLML